MAEIEMRKISLLKGFNSNEFCINPYHWGFTSIQAPTELLRKAQELSEEIDGIAIAIIHNDENTFVLSEPFGNIEKFILFNATKSTPQNEKVIRAIIFDSTRGIVSKYLFEQDLVFAPGLIF